jgi:hypothetical protein
MNLTYSFNTFFLIDIFISCSLSRLGKTNELSSDTEAGTLTRDYTHRRTEDIQHGEHGSGGDGHSDDFIHR